MWVLCTSTEVNFCVQIMHPQFFNDIIWFLEEHASPSDSWYNRKLFIDSFLETFLHILYKKHRLLIRWIALPFPVCMPSIYQPTLFTRTHFVDYYFHKSLFGERSNLNKAHSHTDGKKVESQQFVYSYVWTSSDPSIRTCHLSWRLHYVCI